MEKIIETLAEVFTTYGLSGLISLVVAFGCIWYFTQKLAKKDKKTESMINEKFSIMNDMIVKQNETLHEEIKDSYNELREDYKELVKQIIEDSRELRNAEHKASINTRASIVTPRMHETIQNLRMTYHADRVCVAEFHNQTENLNGLAYVKYDIVDEDTSQSVRTIGKYYQNCHIGGIWPVIDDFNTYGGLVKYDSAAIGTMNSRSSALYDYLMNDSDARYAIYICLYDGDEMIGYLSMEYILNDIIEEIMDWDDIKEKAKELSVMISIHQEEN